MERIALHPRFNSGVVQLPGRRVTSLAAGLGSMLLLVDAVIHPGPVAELWMIRTAQEPSGAGWWATALFVAVLAISGVVNQVARMSKVDRAGAAIAPVGDALTVLPLPANVIPFERARVAQSSQDHAA